MDKDRFVRIESDVCNFYSKLVNSFTSLRKYINILPIINNLIEALRGLYVSHMLQIKTDKQIMELTLMMTTSHKQVILTLKLLLKKYKIEIGSANIIQHFIATYINEVNKIIHDFDKIIDNEETTICWVNQKTFYKNTPKLIDMIFDLILLLTDDKPKERGFAFTFE